MPDPDKPKKIFICEKDTVHFFSFFFFSLSSSLLHICLKILSYKAGTWIPGIPEIIMRHSKQNGGDDSEQTTSREIF